MKNLLLSSTVQSGKGGEIFFTRGSDRRVEIVLRPRRRTFWGFSFLTVLTFLMCWIWFAIYFHYKLLLWALRSYSVFSNASLCLSIEALAVRDITWVVTTWLVFMAAISEDIWSNQPHANSDTGWAKILKSMDPGVSGATGMEWNRNNNTFLFSTVLLGLYRDCRLIWLHYSRCRYFFWIL